MGIDLRNLNIKTYIRKPAFTLSEVLITLSIIGIIASMTMPSMIQKHQKKVLREQFKVAYSLLQQMIVKVQADWGYYPDCYYWTKNPHGASKCDKFNKYGGCIHWTLVDGSPLPAGYNGQFGECTAYMQELGKQFRTAAICDNNAYGKGCIADLPGIDTTMTDNDSSITPEEAEGLVSGCGGFRESSIHNNLTAYVLVNGVTVIPYSDTAWPIWLVDINGKKGPNKWGYDLFPFTLRGMPGQPIKLDAGGCGAVAKGGVSTWQMLRDMYSK